MARSIVGGLIAVVVILAAFLMLRGRGAGPSAEARAALETWLDTSCTTGADHRAENALRSFGAELEMSLINLFQNGPSASEIAHVENVARHNSERIRAVITWGSKAGLPEKDLQALRASLGDKDIALARQEYISSRRSAALVGLGIIGGREGRRLLEQIAADPSSTYQYEARLARYGESAAEQK